jgi:hypothetical protein
MIFGNKCTRETVLMAILPEIPKNVSDVAQALGCSSDTIKESLAQVEVKGDVNFKIISLYLAMLLAHAAHVFEETWGNFRLVRILGLGKYLFGNWVLYSIPFVILYYLIKGKLWAYYLGFLYAVIMVLNGLGHNVAYILTRKYFGAYAGNFTGIALVLIGIPLAYYIMKEIKVEQT